MTLRFAALCAFIALPLAASPARADTLIDDVVGLTLNEEGDVETFSAILIGDDGRIEDVFARKDKRPKEVEYRLDGRGRVVIPGLVDSHANVMELGLARLKAKAGFKGDPTGDPRPEDLDMAFAEAQELLLASGITTVVDAGTTIEDWQAYRRAGDRGALRIRLVAYAEGTANMALIGGPGPTPWLYDGRLKQVGVVITLDGLPETHEAWLKAPYSDAPGKTGEPGMTQARLKNMMSRAAIDNFQVAVRARGDAAGATVLDAVEELRKTYSGDRRWRIEGADLVDTVDLSRFVEGGVVASMQPARLSIESAIGEALLGPERLGTVQRWRSLQDAGAALVFGTGTRGEAPAPFQAMALAMSRQAGPEEAFGGWQPQERVARETALAAFTTEAARALYAEDRIGRIAKGMSADFLFIDRDPLLVPPRELRDTRVLETWIGGVKVFDANGDSEEPQATEIEGR